MAQPLFILQWHITHRCNLRCSHCYQEDYRSHMPRETLFRALDSFDSMMNGRRAQINLTGGEPLLHPDFFPLAEEIRLRGYRLGVLTNGTLIDAETAAKLAALHPAFVQISLDGPRKIHDAIRGEGAFDSALKGMDCLKAAGVKVLVSFTAQKKNAASFAALEKACLAHGVDKLWWDRVVSDRQDLVLTTGQFRRLCAKACRLTAAEKRRRGKEMVSCGRALQSDPACGGSIYTCAAGKDLLILLADGSLMPCRRLPFVIGNIRDGEMKDIIARSPLMRKLAEPVVPEGCGRCRWLSSCGGGSRCVTYAQTGRLDLRDVNCFRRKK